jgi:hypothetical protein
LVEPVLENRAWPLFCKKAVARCNARYIEKIEASERDRDGDINALAREAGPQATEPPHRRADFGANAHRYLVNHRACRTAFCHSREANPGATKIAAIDLPNDLSR